MNRTSLILKQMVLDELLAIKQHATYEEINRLDFDKFDGSDYRLCIYGLMTGDCYSERAVELLNLCTIPFSQSTVHYDPIPGDKFLVPPRQSLRNGYSPLEYYITGQEINIFNLIKFLKGEVEIKTIQDL